MLFCGLRDVLFLQIYPGVHFIPEDLTSFKKVSKKPKVNWKRVLLLGGAALTCIVTISWLIKSASRPVVNPVIHPMPLTV